MLDNDRVEADDCHSSEEVLTSTVCSNKNGCTSISLTSTDVICVRHDW